MYSLKLILLTSVWLLQAIATPFPEDLESRAVDCDDISKYTTEFFVEARRFDPETSTCLFYAAKQGDNAKRLTEGKGVGTITIWDVWACDLYDEKSSEQNPNNPLRCIMDEPSKMQTYFENMSRAYAQLCELFVSVITPDLHNIPGDGIWARIEAPEMERTTDFDPPKKRVDTIEAFTPDFEENLRIFQRPNTRRDLSGLARRGPPNNLTNCVPAGTVEARFGNINW